jgi:hypothetical protein
VQGGQGSAIAGLRATERPCCTLLDGHCPTCGKVLRRFQGLQDDWLGFNQWTDKNNQTGVHADGKKSVR